jgi:hypothetical protein
MADCKKKKPESRTLIPSAPNTGLVDECALFERVAAIIENRKNSAAAYANSEIALMYR